VPLLHRPGEAEAFVRPLGHLPRVPRVLVVPWEATEEGAAVRPVLAQIRDDRNQPPTPFRFMVVDLDAGDAGEVIGRFRDYPPAERYLERLHDEQERA
jgi:hypothetical protein